jgi:hypothetical protein
MAATNESLIDGIQPGVTTVVVGYTSPASGAGTRLTAFTATNNSATTAKYSVFIVPNGGAADTTNKIINLNSLAAEAEESPIIQNHFIPAGGTLEVQVDTATTIAFRATGIEYT